ncbi:39S ribosomal protein L47, mitochondrial [Octopus bimaculoides]|uniref:Large ribosomal subunit protein uL29m n=1 Tax=Octopus bimaculoides TaxID=37653 RepID=A0A0L8HRB0_OCTBM|nr:39S ribosomal protein L47, mitochondrial [Octopus bimaculoides]|eukprot:XP_014770092.1 PREDICTED: 39S ribosomal protein L47, mitochondrial-like [Octopus bimaculoides]
MESGIPPSGRPCMKVDPNKMFSRCFFPRHLQQVTLQIRTLSLTSSQTFCKRSEELRAFNNTTTVYSCSSHQTQISVQRTTNCQHRLSVRSLHTTPPCSDLMEFFDDKKNWGKETILTGRPWHLAELRLKSNEDLHKLWYILLKERNMLMTMEAEYIRRAELFPNPERLFKVDESMQNILEIVAERDDAVSLLETGKSCRPEYRMVRNFLGLKYRRKIKEHAIPPRMNLRYRMLHTPFVKGLTPYFGLYFEKQRMLAKRRQKRRLQYNKRLQKAFPHLQLEIEENKQSI